MTTAASTTSIEDRFMTHKTGLRGSLLVALLALTAMLVAAAPASADFGIKTFTTNVTDHRAGGYPDATTEFSFDETSDGAFPTPDGGVRDIEVALPPGLIGDPSATPLCTNEELGDDVSRVCPPETQVGVLELDFALLPSSRTKQTVPVYNVVPNEGEPARFAFALSLSRIRIDTAIRTGGDYGLTTTISSINRAARLFGSKLTLWGVPADPSHDAQRLCGATVGCPSPLPERKPLMRNPTACDGPPLVTTLRARSWEDPDRWVTAESASPRPQDCENVPFAPTIAVAPGTAMADTPTGLTVDVDVPQNTDPAGRASGDLRKAVVTLPDGLTLSPGVADGLTLCTAAQFGETENAPARCPDAATLGSVAIDSPLVPEPLTGPIWLGPADARAGSYPLYLDAATDGVRLKLAGSVQADPATGRLTATFAKNPELPFSRFRLTFDGGPRAALATPQACAGPGTATADLTPWGAPLTPAVLGTTSTVSWDGCGAQPFAPAFVAGTTNAAAGKATGLTLQLRRDDRTQALGQIASVRLPQGLMANIGSVPRCGEAAAAAGTCGAASRLGSVVVGSGAGSAPLHLSGDAYLTDGYKGAPFGMMLAVRAVAGPLDFGTIVVRAAIRVGADARIAVETDPLPQMLGGIPLRLRSIALTLDRAGFMLNPTSCDPMEIGATLKSAGGASVERTSRFQVGGCGALPFRPQISANATGGGKSKPAGLKVHVGQTAGQANLRSVTVDVPKQLSVRLAALGTLCSTAQLAADACPAATKVGTATAVTPILATPLTGPVYLVDGGKPLPTLVAQLRGSRITLPLTGDVALVGGRLRTTFATIPDVPITAFDLDLPATGNPVLQTASALPCGGLQLDAVLVGQNGARQAGKAPVAVACPLAVTSKRLSGNVLVLGVQAPGAGRLTLSGAGLRTTKRTVKQAGTVSVRVKLSTSGQRKLRRTKRFTGRVRVGYRPTRGAAASTSAQVKLKAPRPRR